MSISQYPSSSGGSGSSLAGKFLSGYKSYGTGAAVIDSSGSAQKLIKKVSYPYPQGSYFIGVDSLPSTPSEPSDFYVQSGQSFYPLGKFNDEVTSPWTTGQVVQYPTASFVFSVNHGNQDTAITTFQADRKFISVGNSGRWATSADGKSWTDRGYLSVASYNALYRIKFGNGILVATGGSGRIVTSTDGINWVSATSGVSDTLMNEIYFENGTFFILTGNKVLKSTDGVSWSSSNVSGLYSGQAGYSDLAYGNGAYVLTLRQGNKVMSSVDGSTWTDITSSFSGISYPMAVAYGNNKFVVIDENISFVWTSPDGITWTKESATNLQQLNTAIRGLQFLDGKFIALNPQYGMEKIIQSTDGITWSVLGRYATGGIYKEIMEDNGTFYLREANVLYITTDISKRPDEFAVLTFEAKAAI